MPINPPWLLNLPRSYLNNPQIPPHSPNTHKPVPWPRQFLEGGASTVPVETKEGKEAIDKVKAVEARQWAKVVRQVGTRVHGQPCCQLWQVRAKKLQYQSVLLFSQLAQPFSCIKLNFPCTESILYTRAVFKHFVVCQNMHIKVETSFPFQRLPMLLLAVLM